MKGIVSLIIELNIIEKVKYGFGIEWSNGVGYFGCLCYIVFEVIFFFLGFDFLFWVLFI